jgi:hypothetical protein
MREHTGHDSDQAVMDVEYKILKQRILPLKE